MKILIFKSFSVSISFLIPNDVYFFFSFPLNFQKQFLLSGNIFLFLEVHFQKFLPQRVPVDRKFSQFILIGMVFKNNFAIAISSLRVMAGITFILSMLWLGSFSMMYGSSGNNGNIDQAPVRSTGSILGISTEEI